MTIVVAYVPSPFGAAALEVGITEAQLRNEPLLVVNGNRDGHRDLTNTTGEHLDQLRAELAERGIAAEVERVVGPDVGEEILAAAARVDATLIVVGVRGRTPIGKLIIGSVGQRLVLDAECPVITVKAKPELGRR